MKPEEKPIGYWLRLLDRLIEDCFEAALHEDGLSRRHWQLMNLLRTAAASTDEIDEAMRPFWTEGEMTLEEALDGLIRRGWVRHEHDRRWRLTLQGEAARADVAVKVQEVRHALTDGISNEEYKTIINALRRMVDNLMRARTPT
jgi:Mn-dependent DtxR family transcriptional regulator